MRSASLGARARPGGGMGRPRDSARTSLNPRERLLVECSVFLGPWFLVVSGCVFLASQLVFNLLGGAVAER